MRLAGKYCRAIISVMTLTATTFPGFETAVRQLVQNHINMPNEPLLLAIYYAPERDPQDVFVFEIAENFGGDMIDPEREMLEARYSSTIDFPMSSDSVLHLTVTNPPEFRTAVSDNWAQIAELRDAIASGNFRILYSDPNKGKPLGALIGA